MTKKRYQYEHCIYHDTSSKGNGRNHDCWRAEIWIDGRRFRKRSRDYGLLVKWLSYIRGGVSAEALEKAKAEGKDDLAPTMFPTRSRSLSQAAREARDNHNRGVRHSRQFRMHDYNLKRD